MVNLVDHPPHYNSHPSGVEAIEITEHLDFCSGNAIKYIWRAGEKNKDKEIQDLRKAVWYLNRWISLVPAKPLVSFPRQDLVAQYIKFESSWKALALWHIINHQPLSAVSIIEQEILRIENNV
jgi:hypothetical protein